MKYLLVLVVAMVTQVYAMNNERTFDPSDPTIWHERPSVQNREEIDESCKMFQPSACPEAYDSQSDTQREKRRRDDKWRNNQIDKLGVK